MSSSSLMTLEELFEANPALKQTKIRIDKATQKASVIDVIRLITGKKSGYASQALDRLDQILVSQCGQLKINGKGRLTPVCDAKTMVQVIWELPGKTAKAFRRQCAIYICRI